MENIIEVINNLNSTDLIAESTSKKLKIYHEYLKSDMHNSEPKFTNGEVKLKSKVKYAINDNPKGLKKLLPFLISNSEKENLSLLIEIDKLIVEKERIFKESYQKDITIVEEFINYAKNKLRTGEIFYYEKDYENYLWTRKEFPQNMFKYLSYQAQINPRILTTKYIDDMKGYFALIGLGIKDENKAKKANQYFSQSKDPFSFNIPEMYNDVKSDIYMSVAVMTENENLLDRIANDVIKKYL